MSHQVAESPCLVTVMSECWWWSPTVADISHRPTLARARLQCVSTPGERSSGAVTRASQGQAMTSLCHCPSPLHVCHQEAGCLCPRGLDCGDLYPAHPGPKPRARQQEPGAAADTAAEVVLGLGTSVILLLLLYIAVIGLKILQQRRRRAEAGAEAEISSVQSSAAASVNTRLGGAITSSICPSPSSSVSPQPITSVSQLLALHQARTRPPNQDLPDLVPAPPLALATPPAPPLSVSMAPPPSLSLVPSLSLAPPPSLSPCSFVSSVSLSLSLGSVSSASSEHSYAHLDHHAPLNSPAPNYWQ